MKTQLSWFFCSLTVIALGAPTTKTSVPADEVLKLLKEGNVRFQQGKPKHHKELVGRRGQLTRSQHPIAAVLGCSDSRVPPEIIFDQTLGDLFVVRVAGNVLDSDITASLEYAVEQLGAKLI